MQEASPSGPDNKKNPADLLKEMYDLFMSELRTDAVKLKAVYEHLYPGNSFDKLTLLNLLQSSADMLYYAPQLMHWELVVRNKIRQAIQAKQAWATRGEPVPNKFIAWLELNGAERSTDYKIAPYGELSDLLTPTEKLGGVVTKPFFIQGIRPHKLECLTGVLDSSQKPVGLIHFIPGDRPRIRQDSSVIKGIRAKT